jgi:hypothetical protein
VKVGEVQRTLEEQQRPHASPARSKKKKAELGLSSAKRASKGENVFFVFVGRSMTLVMLVYQPLYSLGLKLARRTKKGLRSGLESKLIESLWVHRSA